MAGRFFDYFVGYLRVEFRNGPWCGDAEIIFHLSGDTIVTTPCDDNFEKGEPEVNVAEDKTLRCWTSSTVSAFFYNMVHWLEAVACDVSECAFRWEGEGPDGELRWHRGGTDGLLELSWTGTSREPNSSFEHRIRLDKAQMVRAFYKSFCEFVESDRYEPLGYENVTCGDCADLVIEGDGRTTLAEVITHRDNRFARALMNVILDFAHLRSYDHDAEKAQTISAFLQQAEDRLKAPDNPDWTWFGAEWNVWEAEQRQRYLQETVYPGSAGIGYGERLRELRSPLIEHWLATQSVAAEVKDKS